MRKNTGFFALESRQNAAREPPQIATKMPKSTYCVSSLNKTQNIVLYIMIRFYYTKFLALCQHFWHIFCPKFTILCTLQKNVSCRLSAMHKQTAFLPQNSAVFHTFFSQFSDISYAVFSVDFFLFFRQNFARFSRKFSLFSARFSPFFHPENRTFSPDFQQKSGKFFS